MTIAECIALTHFFPNAPFLYPLKTSENRCFQRVEKSALGKNGLVYYFEHIFSYSKDHLVLAQIEQ